MVNIVRSSASCLQINAVTNKAIQLYKIVFSAYPC